MNSLLVFLALAATPSLTADVQARTGYDSNIFYGSALELSNVDTYGPGADFFATVTPQLQGGLALGRLRLGADYALAVTQYGSYAHGFSLLNRALLTQQLVLGRLSLTAFEHGESYAISAFRSDELWRGSGGLHAAVRLGAFEVGLQGEGGARWSPFREVALYVPELDTLVAGALIGRWVRGPWSVGGLLQRERRFSNAPALGGTFDTLSLGAAWSWNRWAPELQAELRRVALPQFAISDVSEGRLDLQAVLRAALAFRVQRFSPGLEMVWERGWSNYATAAFQRWRAGLTLAWRWDVAGLVPGRPSLLPARTAGHFLLKVSLPHARQVSVVGTFNGWAAPGLPLEPAGKGLWQVELSLPPGRYRCQLVVDGVREPPAEAEGYEPDGLGGVDALFTIPDASEPGVMR